jgi:hypothetical protein
MRLSHPRSTKGASFAVPRRRSTDGRTFLRERRCIGHRRRMERRVHVIWSAGCIAQSENEPVSNLSQPLRYLPLSAEVLKHD